MQTSQDIPINMPKNPQSVVNTPQRQRTNVIIIPKITIAIIYPPIYFIDFICSYYNILLAL